MASEPTASPEAGNGRERTDGEDAASHGLAADLPASARHMAEAAAGEVASRLPGAAATTRDAIGEAGRQIESAPTDVLVVGTSLSIGVALGLLLGGANRLLVALALIPAAAMGATLLERRNRDLA